MFQSRQRQIEKGITEVAPVLEEALPTLAELLLGRATVHPRRVSLGPSKQGDGWLAILAVTVPSDSKDVGFDRGFPPGPYVVYGFGQNPIDALAALETQLKEGIATLCPDRYATEVAQDPPKGRYKPR